LLADPATSLADKVPPLQELLGQVGWQPTHPAVSWQVVLDRHGLALSPAARKKKGCPRATLFASGAGLSSPR
ncbi:MAG: hypothetical protein REJ50_02540, partial [Bordetella sp.]|nr:hypothetical protein [Bordetella sp.]